LVPTLTRRLCPAAAIVRNCSRRVEQRRLGDVVGVGERGLLAGDGAHADTLVDAEAAALDDAFLEAPALLRVYWK
jgi:hypothetical protein